MLIREYVCVLLSPDEVPADGAEGRLVEERGRELVTSDFVNLVLFDGSSPPVERRESIFRVHLHRLTWEDKDNCKNSPLVLFIL